MPHMDCKLFVDTKLDEDALGGIVASVCPGTYAYGLLKSPFVEIYIERNETVETKTSSLPANRFLHFPMTMLFTMLAGTSEQEFKAIVERVMRRLQAEGFTVIAACDFEDELPQSYNIRS
jgi:hypothetical protein